MSNAQRISELPIGSVVKMGTMQAADFSSPIAWRIISHDHHTLDKNYPENAVTLIADRVIHNIVYDAKEPNNANTQRASYGNNRYRLSNIRQWLNTSLGASLWYKQQNIEGAYNYNHSDTPPSDEYILAERNHKPYHNLIGFCGMFKPFEINSILRTKIGSSINPDFDYSPTVIDETGMYDVMEDLFYLPSIIELGYGNNTNEGIAFPYFNSSNRRSKMDKKAFDYSKHNTGFTSWEADDAVWEFMTRSAKTDTTSSVYLVDVIQKANLKPNSSLGLRPMCNIGANTLVTTKTDADGHYTIVADVPPVVEIVEIDTLDVHFNVRDMQGTPTEVKAYFNGTLLSTFTDDLNTTLKVTIPYTALNPTNNKLVFTTKDNANYEGTQTFVMQFKENLISTGDTISGRSESFIVNQVVNNNDGTVTATLNKNLRYRINKGREIERLDFKYKPFIHMTDNYHAIPSYSPLSFKNVEYEGKLAIEKWETENSGVYSKLKIEMNRESIHDEIAIKSVNEMFKFKEEM